MADKISEPIKQCAAILKSAKNDTEKFAALFMVTKLVKSKDCTQAGKRVLFEAIGFDFLKKLLTSDDVPDDCPALVYKSVALSILTCFCQDENLATHPDMISSIPVFLEIVQTADDSDSLIVVSEAYSCLQSIAAYEKGREALLKVAGLTKWSEIYLQQSFQTDEALNILVTLANNFGPTAWDSDPKAFHDLLQRLSLDFQSDTTERKFELCDILTSLIFSCRHDLIRKSAEGEMWPESLYKGISDILKSRITKNQRDPTLKLTAQVIELLGIEWTLQETEDPKKFFLLLLQLAAIEVRMQMDNKSFNQSVSNADLITSCFLILEHSLNFMASDQIDFEQKEKQQTYTALKGAFTAVLGVLTKLTNDKISENLDGKNKIFTCAMIRVLSAWLSQETSAMRTQVYKILPFILKLSNKTFYEFRQFYLDNKDKESFNYDLDAPIDVLRVFLPALCHLVVEDEGRKIFLKSKEEDVLYDFIMFHWSIAHYKRPPIPRAERLKRMNEPDPELSQQQLDAMKDSRSAIISACNILMNITVLEAKFVEESLTFNNLLKFILTNLPEFKDTPENLVALGHLSVLGLLLLKQQSKKVKKNDFSICRYIQITIRFLWDAYTLDESNDPEALVVSITYKEFWNEIAELWFLGMQTMSSIIQQIPWISEFAIESGWCEGIIDILKKVRIGTLPPNVKSAYEDFLTQLIDANPDVAGVLKKADALRVCRNHRLMDLGKKLFGD
ncbi:hypothetical protein PVAND_003910 [Polypedilum vanderplanki]|uniref:Neurochondrin-like protein n=1 Tax=Polypedilum vanderplanki TaxID=319348 RepID=A0A9J6BWL5_POLVA|nr:hypothetical protein PVAND_003910 [Polypedilum vanderplanki]